MKASRMQGLKIISSKKEHVSATPATEWLKAHKVPSEGCTYEYIENGGNQCAAKCFNVDEHMVIKTLIMQNESATPLVILMHGDCEVSTKSLARQVGAKHIEPCKPEQAERNSGYRVGGTSPFNTRKRMPIYVQKTILDLPQIYINGGRRGFNIKIDPQILVTVLGAKTVDCALSSTR